MKFPAERTDVHICRCFRDHQRCFCIGLALSVAAISLNFQAGYAAAQQMRFSEAGTDVIEFENRSRRKWDAPLIADLDQDGLLDVLITEHSKCQLLYWNEGGKFSSPQTIYKGDSHGVTAGDIDNDGLIDLIVAQGGGGGKKPRNPVVYQVNRDRTITGGDELQNFERSRGRATMLFDSNSNGKLDLLVTAFPLKSQIKGMNDMYRNVGDRAFEFFTKLPRAQWMGFRVLPLDYNNDNFVDFLFYGGKDMVLAEAQPDGSYVNVSEKALGIAANTSFVSCVAQVDYDNDGDFDLFLTRADHPFDPKKHYDSQGKRFSFFSRFKPLEFEDMTVEGDFKLENLQMAYPDFDVFVGDGKRKLEFDVDRHGHKDFTLKQEEADGWPDDRNDVGLYIGHIGDNVWRMYCNTKSATAGVVHNVTSNPMPTASLEKPCVLLENRGGQFADVTTRLGIKIPEQTTGAAVGDFDNDGWTDLFIVLHGNPASPTRQVVLRNNKGNWFDSAKDHGVVSKELGAIGMGAEAFDYDGDGDLDLIYCTERGRWHLMTNELDSKDNNYLEIKVGDSPSGKATAMGAVLTLKIGDNTYRRVVGTSTAAFGQSLNNHLHVGLGQSVKIDSAEVRWTNGESREISVNEVNTVITVGNQ